MRLLRKNYNEAVIIAVTIIVVLIRTTMSVTAMETTTTTVIMAILDTATMAIYKGSYCNYDNDDSDITVGDVADQSIGPR